jgi:site-specific recombinase XerD
MGRNPQPAFNLYTPAGERKYVNQAERRRLRRVLTTKGRIARERVLFLLILASTGARISELLAVRASSFQIESGLVALHTLKRRRPHVREVPIAPALMAAIVRHFRLRNLQCDAATTDRRLWPWSRWTAWRLVKTAMQEAGIVGRRACPRGLRHGFGVGTLQAGVPINLVQRWLGHARLSTTAIYASASGPEEASFASRFWRGEDSAGV